MYYILYIIYQLSILTGVFQSKDICWVSVERPTSPEFQGPLLRKRWGKGAAPHWSHSNSCRRHCALAHSQAPQKARGEESSLSLIRKNTHLTSHTFQRLHRTVNNSRQTKAFPRPNNA